MLLPAIAGIVSRNSGGGGGGVVLEDWENSANGDVSVSNLLFTAPSGIAANELLLILPQISDASDRFTSTPAGWLKLGFYGYSRESLCIFYKIADGSETDVTVNLSTQVQGLQGWYARVSGVNTVSPFNVVGTKVGTTATALGISAVTTYVDACLAFYLYVTDGATLPLSVAGTGWTELDELKHHSTDGWGIAGSFGTKEQETAGSTGIATVTAPTVDTMVGLQFAIAPA